MATKPPWGASGRIWKKSGKAKGCLARSSNRKFRASNPCQQTWPESSPSPPREARAGVRSSVPCRLCCRLGLEVGRLPARQEMIDRPAACPKNQKQKHQEQNQRGELQVLPRFDRHRFRQINPEHGSEENRQLQS